MGCAALIPTVGMPNWSQEDQELEEYSGERAPLQEWDSMLGLQPNPTPAFPPSGMGWNCSDPFNLTASEASGRCAVATAATSETNSTKGAPRVKDKLLWTNPWNLQK